MAKKRTKSVKKGNKNLNSLLIVFVGVIIIFLILLGIKKSIDDRSEAAERQALMTGSGAPSGAHYNLNIIGVQNSKDADMTGGDGHRIFVPLTGTCKINLSEGDFQVLDGNCTDNGTAAFQLPNPDPLNTGTTKYSVYARALGKPGGSSTTTTCATDVATGELYCSVYQSVLTRKTGKSTFTNVSKQLLYIYADLNGDGTPERYNLFSDSMKDYYWNYDNNGLKLAQLRFYEISTTVP